MASLAEPRIAVNDSATNHAVVGPLALALPGLDAPVEGDRSEAEVAREVLARLYDMIPGATEAAPRKRHAERRKMHRRWAVRMDEIVPDAPGFVSALRLDVDAADAEESWREAGLPPPNLVVTNPTNGHAHLWWMLRVWTRRDNDRQMAFLRDLRIDATRIVPGADPAAALQDMTHSPWSPNYRTRAFSTHLYDLRELRAAIPRAERARRMYGNKPITTSRNDYVFRVGLRYGKAELRRGRELDLDLERDVAAAMREAAQEARTTIGGSHPYYSHELAASLRSVLKYMRRDVSRVNVVQHPALRRLTERDRKRRRRGSVALEEYRALAAERRERIKELSAEGYGPTEMAKILGCSRAEIYRLRSSEQSAAATVLGCPALQDYDAFRVLPRTPERARETPVGAVERLERLLAGERVSDHLWLLDPKGCGCGLSGRQREIRDALLDVERERSDERRGIVVPIRSVPTEQRIAETPPSPSPNRLPPAAWSDDEEDPGPHVLPGHAFVKQKALPGSHGGDGPQDVAEYEPPRAAGAEKPTVLGNIRKVLGGFVARLMRFGCEITGSTTNESEDDHAG
jgi:hypothetical protein